MPAPAVMRARDPDEIRAAMKARGGLTHRELAVLADCTKGALDFILAGQRNASRDLAKRIARVLRRPVDALFVPATSSSKQPDGEQEAVA
jgi:transcriptional regulator with XRE-family HTH domain